MSSPVTSSATRVKPPSGWTDDEAFLSRIKRNRWDCEDGLKADFAGEEYNGLKDSTPIWVHLPKYGECLFIFEATKEGETEKSYYLFNGLGFTLWGFELRTLEEIGRAITDLGSPEGYLDGLKGMIDLNYHAMARRE